MQQLIFVIDPMCSWCWGFHPVMEELRKKHPKKYKYSLVVGGLRTTGDMQWNRKSKDYLQHNWEKVHQLTKQKFSAKILIKDAFNYDTYPACKAIVTIRELWGDEASFQYLNAIQEAFYLRGEDITKLSTLLEYVEKQKDFLEFYKSERAEKLMQHDFSKARSMGATAFPSVVKIDKQGHMVCQKGYRSLEDILKF